MKDHLSLSELLAGLNDKSSARRRSAARKIGKGRNPAAGEALHAAFLKEQRDSRTWETQVEMIEALGLLGHKEAFASMKAIITANFSAARPDSFANCSSADGGPGAGVRSRGCCHDHASGAQAGDALGRAAGAGFWLGSAKVRRLRRPIKNGVSHSGAQRH